MQVPLVRLTLPAQPPAAASGLQVGFRGEILLQ